MSVFYMLCSKDKEKGHEGIAMEITLEYVFASIEVVKPLAIVINKSPTFFNEIRTIVKMIFFVGKMALLKERKLYEGFCYVTFMS